LSLSTTFAIQRFEQPKEISCYTSAMVRESKNKQKVVKDGVMNERSREISVMSWRCEKCGEFGIQQVEQSAVVVVFAEVTTTR